jgi:hypothetical protein
MSHSCGSAAFPSGSRWWRLAVAPAASCGPASRGVRRRVRGGIALRACAPRSRRGSGTGSTASRLDGWVGRLTRWIGITRWILTSRRVRIHRQCGSTVLLSRAGASALTRPSRLPPATPRSRRPQHGPTPPRKEGVPHAKREAASPPDHRGGDPASPHARSGADFRRLTIPTRITRIRTGMPMIHDQLIVSTYRPFSGGKSTR